MPDRTAAEALDAWRFAERRLAEGAGRGEAERVALAEAVEAAKQCYLQIVADVEAHLFSGPRQTRPAPGPKPRDDADR